MATFTESQTCAATTIAGKPCKRKSKLGSFCVIHKNYKIASVDMEIEKPIKTIFGQEVSEKQKLLEITSAEIVKNTPEAREKHRKEMNKILDPKIYVPQFYKDSKQEHTKPSFWDRIKAKFKR